MLYLGHDHSKMSVNRISTGLGVVVGLSIASVVGSYPAIADTTFYGIDNANNIWEVDPVSKFNVLVNEVGRTISDCATTTGCLNTSQGSNGIAYDKDRDHLLFFYNPKGINSNQPWNLQLWNRKTSGPGSLKTIEGITGTNIPANAAYFNNALWYFDGGSSSQRLNKVSFTYNTNEDDIVSALLTSYDLKRFAAPIYQAGGYGDIAINTKSGFLYGSQSTNGRFFKLNLNEIDNPSRPNVYTPLGRTQTLNSNGTSFVDSGLQLSFNSDYSKLYGTRFCNVIGDCSGYNNSEFTAQAGDGLFFEINDFDSKVDRQLGLNDLLFSSSPGYRDLSGATAAAPAPAPGPLPILGVGGAFAWSRRLRRKISTGRTQQKDKQSA